MFNIAEMKVKLIIYAIIAGIIITLGLVAKHYYDSNLKNELIVKDLADANKTLKDQYDLMKAAKLIDNGIITAQQESITRLTDLNETNKTKVVTEVKKIVEKYASLPKTDENVKLRDRDISIVRIVGLWETTCSNYPQLTECIQLKKEQQ